ncbi:unnamed protein product [Prorocentrum cordatum]|uniref:EF-hand domain-containing protein n=1 Tax=Prorocentrum cordatum TaxID=2364126 RepID=A0ABN9WNW2_9DINO|nr:unnamed protein product [Polarella glacialis]
MSLRVSGGPFGPPVGIRASLRSLGAGAPRASDARGSIVAPRGSTRENHGSPLASGGGRGSPMAAAAEAPGGAVGGRSSVAQQQELNHKGQTHTNALQGDLVRFDALLTELRREHEGLARRLRGQRAQQPPGGEAPAGRPPAREDRCEAGPHGEGALPVVEDAWAHPCTVQSAWGSGPEPEAQLAGVVFRDPTESLQASADSDRSGAYSTSSGGVHKSRIKSMGRSLTVSVGDAISRSFTAGNDAHSVFSNPEDAAPKERGFCYAFVSSPMFELIWSTAILLNTLTMALEAQYDGMDGSYRYDLGRSPSTQPASEVWPGADTLFIATDMVFGVLFTLELLWRIVVLRKELFLDIQLPTASPGAWWRTWSWIDITAVTFWYIERLSQSTMSLEINPKVIRVARLVKLLRFIRVIRFINAFEKLFSCLCRDTRVITIQFAVDSKLRSQSKASFSALAWSSAVLLLVEIVFALLLNILLEGFWNDADNPMEDRQVIFQHFGTFSKSLLSMFEMLLGNWYSITRELVKVNEWYMVLGVGHQLAFGFAVIEVMTGVFLHETFQVASLDDGIMTNETKRAIQRNTEKMKQFFESADSNGDGFLDKQELEQVLQRARVQEWLSGMGLNIPDVVTAFTVMDENGDGLLSAKDCLWRGHGT